MGTGVSPSLRVIQQVAAAEDVDPGELEPPLHEVLDPDALDALVRSTRRRPGSDGAETTIEFTYRGQRVRVDGTGAVEVTPTTQRRQRPDSNPNSAAKDDSHGD